MASQETTGTVAEQTDDLPVDGPGIVRAAGDSTRPRVPRQDDERVQTAADWLLSAFDQTPEITHTVRVNIGGVSGSPSERFIDWKIKALPGGLVRKIREDAEAVVRRQGTSGAGAVSSSFQAAVRYVIEASVDPNIKEISRSRNIADPAMFLEEALSLKQGLIEQLSGKILALSGYDADDVQDAIEVRAAGNSSSSAGS